jgi:hypothetical protein
MTLHAVKLIGCAAGLAFVLSSSADAAKHIRKPRHHVPHVAASSERCRGANLFPCGPIYDGNVYLGDDPDPFIRSMIQRDLGVHYGGPD